MQVKREKFRTTVRVGRLNVERFAARPGFGRWARVGDPDSPTSWWVGGCAFGHGVNVFWNRG